MGTKKKKKRKRVLDLKYLAVWIVDFSLQY